MTTADALLLGLIQGLTEFLPVSSSGHLVLGQDLMGLELGGGVAFEVVVHLGTLASVVFVFRKFITEMVFESPALLRPAGWKSRYADRPAFRRLVLLVPATIPAALVGFLGKDALQGLFENPRVVACMLGVTGLILFLPLRFGSRDSAGGLLDLPRALIMGVAQAAAIIPGISRSGSTITAGLCSGLDREEAGAFSFLMAIPAILGAAVLELGDLEQIGLGAGPLIAGFLAAAVSGYLALLLLLRMVRHGRLWVFSPYLLAVLILWLILA